MTAVDQHQGTLERRAAAQIIVDQEAPLADDVFGRLGKAVAGHVDQPQLQRLAHVEEVELLRAAGRVRGACEAVAVGERVEQRRFADIGATRERNLRHVGRRQIFEAGRGLEERDRAGEQFARGLDQVFLPGRGFGIGHDLGSGFMPGVRE
jgi:hypothetical protein